MKKNKCRVLQAPTWIRNELKEGIIASEAVDDDADSEQETDSDGGTDSEAEDDGEQDKNKPLKKTGKSRNDG